MSPLQKNWEEDISPTEATTINKRKRVYTVCIVFAFLLASLFSYGIYAYLTDADQADNSFTIGGNRVEIVEQFEPPKEILPGSSFTKDVKVQNVGPNSCYVRVKAVFTDSDMEQYCTVDWNTTDWIYNETDGYYYYPNVLATEEITPSLFTTVSVSDAIPTNEIKDFDILVYTESYQSADYSDYQDAWTTYQKNKPKEG